jgi:hypothetical protein
LEQIGVERCYGDVKVGATERASSTLEVTDGVFQETRAGDRVAADYANANLNLSA